MQTYYMGYNLSDPVFSDQAVREAITMAIDKDTIVANIFGGLYEKADTFFSKSVPYCDVDQKVYGYDIEAAKQLLDEAGYADTDGDGIREKDGVKLSAVFAVGRQIDGDDKSRLFFHTTQN